jgi:hypothetical protein
MLTQGFFEALQGKKNFLSGLLPACELVQRVTEED